MTRETTPYDVVTEVNSPTLSLRTRVIAGCVGMLVLFGSAAMLGASLFAVLVSTAGRTQPAPMEYSQLLQGTQQQTILTTGGMFTLAVSVSLANYVFSKILKSQQMVAAVTLRRQELQTIVGQMHSAVHELKKKNDQQQESAR